MTPAGGTRHPRPPHFREALLSRLGTPWARVVTLFARTDWDEGALLMGFALVIGVGAGLGVVGFYHLIDAAYDFFIVWIGTRLRVTTHVAYRPALTALGLWAAWALVRRIPEGQNVPDVKLAVAKRGGVLWWRQIALRTLAAAVTLGSGGSAGSEGPTAVLGAGVGSVIGQALRFQQRRIKILVGCGAGAGIAAAFNAPFAGAFFALEEVLGSFSIGAFSPVVVASVAAALTVRPFLGSHPAFHIPAYGQIRVASILLFYPLLGIVCGMWSALYTRTYFRSGDMFKAMRGPHWLRPVCGGLAVGFIVYLSGDLLIGNGHLAIPAPVFGGIAWYLLIALALAKSIATSVTLSSG